MANPKQRTSESSRRPLLFVALGSALILAVGVASFRLVGPDDDTFDDVAPVALQATGNTRPDDFFGNLDAADQDDAADDDVDGDATEEDAAGSPIEITEKIAILEPFAGTSRTVRASLSGRQAVGTEPGLYSGNRLTPACDVDALLEHLDDDANADQAQAWSNVLGIEPNGPDEPDESDEADELEESEEEPIPDYVTDLTPVRLRLDTRVTNHDFSDGRATPFQSILQSGSAVMVDDTGVPRVACSSGNPLTQSAPLGDLDEDNALELDSIADDAEAAWLGLDPAEVVTITPGDEPVDAFVLVNIDDGGLLERPSGTNGQRDFGTGDFLATLRWESPADLDLEVIEPNGTRIYAENPSPGSSKGELDVDANARCEQDSTGEESISWPDGDAPSGDYEVIVRGFAVGAGYEPDCGLGPADYTLTIKLFGQDDQVHEGRIGDSNTDEYSATIE